MIGAQPSRRLEFVLAAGRGDDAAVEQLGQLDGGRSDAARCGQHQHVLARLEAGASEQHMPGGEEHQRHGGGFFELELVWNGDDRILRRGDQFGIAAWDAVAEHHVAWAEVVRAFEAFRALATAQAGRQQHALTGFDPPAQLARFDHFAGNVAAQDMRHRESDAGDALPQP